jgi:hypothetical protein
MQPGARTRSKEMQANPNKSKQKLAFPWIPLAESGLFKGLEESK